MNRSSHDRRLSIAGILSGLPFLPHQSKPIRSMPNANNISRRRECSNGFKLRHETMTTTTTAAKRFANYNFTFHESWGRISRLLYYRLSANLCLSVSLLHREVVLTSAVTFWFCYGSLYLVRLTQKIPSTYKISSTENGNIRTNLKFFKLPVGKSSNIGEATVKIPMTAERSKTLRHEPSQQRSLTPTAR